MELLDGKCPISSWLTVSVYLFQHPLFLVPLFGRLGCVLLVSQALPAATCRQRSLAFAGCVAWNNFPHRTTTELVSMPVTQALKIYYSA